LQNDCERRAESQKPEQTEKESGAEAERDHAEIDWIAAELEDAGGNDFRRRFADVERCFRPDYLPRRQKSEGDPAEDDRDADNHGRGARHELCRPRQIENKTQDENGGRDQVGHGDDFCFAERIALHRKARALPRPFRLVP
jgi:hypothetical protein